MHNLSEFVCAAGCGPLIEAMDRSVACGILGGRSGLTDSGSPCRSYDAAIVRESVTEHQGVSPHSPADPESHNLRGTLLTQPFEAAKHQNSQCGPGKRPNLSGFITGSGKLRCLPGLCG